ncbi:hypothetical protein GJ496_005116 [Pomphorhynchus laevis]|nr:hypothetical protein GJ496_005116 [Pomphorhynchus laevis]
MSYECDDLSELCSFAKRESAVVNRILYKCWNAHRRWKTCQLVKRIQSKTANLTDMDQDQLSHWCTLLESRSETASFQCMYFVQTNKCASTFLMLAASLARLNLTYKAILNCLVDINSNNQANQTEKQSVDEDIGEVILTNEKRDDVEDHCFTADTCVKTDVRKARRLIIKLLKSIDSKTRAWKVHRIIRNRLRKHTYEYTKALLKCSKYASKYLSPYGLEWSLPK